MRQRLQKIIAASGTASRRKSEEIIKSGRVTVNGAVASLGDSADPDTDRICVDGRPIAGMSRRTYIMLNKPRGFVTTMHDDKGRKCVSDLVKGAGARLYPVGRLDMYSEGLLIMTNDGEFANRMMHPSLETKKVYHAYINGECSPEALKILRSPIVIDGYRTRPAQVSVISEEPDETVLSVCIHEGRNRQIRRMCEAAGLKLRRLVRVSEGSLRLGDLRTGHWRRLTNEELQDLGVK